MPKGSRRHRGGRRSLNRQRDQRPSFHIFCEGKNTEAAYFKSFPMNNMPYCKGDGKTKTKLVEEAIKYKKQEGIKKGDPDQIWVVFDYDVDPLKADQKQGYNSAIQKANANGIKWAVSNDSFELWYLLHFRDCHNPEHRDWILTQLKVHVPDYDKDVKITKAMYSRLLMHQDIAIERASDLASTYDSKNENYATRNPYTTVYKLVEELNKYI